MQTPDPEHYDKCLDVMCEQCQMPRLEDVKDMLPEGFCPRYTRARNNYIEGIRMLRESLEKYQVIKASGETGKPRQQAELSLGYLNASLAVAKSNYYNHARDVLCEVRKKREPASQRASPKRLRQTPCCDICYDEEPKNMKALQCGHCFCSDCCNALMNNPRPTCPHCRERFVIVIDLKNLTED